MNADTSGSCSRANGTAAAKNSNEKEIAISASRRSLGFAGAVIRKIEDSIAGGSWTVELAIAPLDAQDRPRPVQRTATVSNGFPL